MKLTLIITAFSLIIQMIPGRLLKAQDTLVAFDTIRLFRTNNADDEYSLEDTLINTIRIQTIKPAQMNDVKFKPGGIILGGVMTLATGIGFGSSKEVDWYLSSTVQTNNSDLDWIFDMYCPGYVEKERTRIKNDDGSYSVETNYVNRFSWHAGALGFIIETGDTIAWYHVYMNPRTDTAVIKWKQSVYQMKNEHPGKRYMEFALLGKFSGTESSLFYNSDDDRIYLFTGTMLSGLFQCQKPAPQMVFKKKKRVVIQPYLLVNTKLTEWERMDILRLSLVGLRMKKAVVNY